MSHLVGTDIVDHFLCWSVKSFPIGVNVQAAAAMQCVGGK